MAAKNRRRRTGSTKKADQKKRKGRGKENKKAKAHKTYKAPRTRIYNQSAISGGTARYLDDEEPRSFHEIIIKNIVSNSNRGKNVPDESLLFGAALSSLSNGMREMRYKQGMNVGKTLYKQSASSKNYMSTEESVQGLVTFFEAAGYHDITYRAYPDDFEIKVHDGNSTDVGANIHSFEAGIISGYLSAALGKYTEVSESTCSNNNSGCCTFTAKKAQRSNGYRSIPSIEKFAASVSEKAKNPSWNLHSAHVLDSYSLLSSSQLLDSSYMEPLKEIASHAGRKISDRLFEGKRAHRAFFSYIENTIRLLNLGEPEVMSSDPLRMQVKFSSVDSRRENVDLALAFIEGLLSEKFGKEFTASESTSNGRYVLDIMETK